MVESRPSRAAERLGFTILVVFLVGLGWFLLFGGELSLRGKGGRVSQVGGDAGTALALGFFGLAAVLSPLLARSLGLRMRSALMLALLAVIPPLCFLAVRSLAASIP